MLYLPILTAGPHTPREGALRGSLRGYQYHIPITSESQWGVEAGARHAAYA